MSIAKQQFNQTQWILGGIITLLVVVAWTSVRWPMLRNGLNAYDAFALFGLLAFGLMWTHYIAGSVRRRLGLQSQPTLYGRVTMIAVLAFLLLHVGLLSFALWRDGLGLPPLSYVSAYSYAIIAIVCGSISLSIFLVYELHRWFKEAQWWKYVEWLQIIAMVAVFYHALELGHEVSASWFTVVWWALGAAFVLSTVYNYRYDRRQRLKGGVHAEEE